MKKQLLRGLARARRFWMQPASPLPLAILRIGLGGLLVLQAALIAPRIMDLYGPTGIVRDDAARELVPASAPRLGWAVAALAAVGLTASEAIHFTLFVHVVAAIGLLVGWRSRLCAFVAWGTHLLLMGSNDGTIYGAVEFLNIALFYSCLLPVGATLSVDRWAGREDGRPSSDARVGVRLLELHLVVVYVASGFEKATGPQWWSGEAIWRALMRSDLATTDFGWIAAVPWLATLAGWGTLVLEVGYGFWIWPRFSRRVWALAIVSLHVGIAVTLGLYLFAGIMILLNVCAWLIPCEP